MNKEILDLINTYPTDGTHKYYWVNGFDGVTQNLYCRGSLVASAEALKRTYCCGLTFEVWYLVASKLGIINTLDAKAIVKIKRDWFVASGGRKGPVDALIPRHLGTEITLKDAQPGDFMQIWRTSKSGHSVIYLSHDDKSLTYWSTQPSTNGIGKRTEPLSQVKGINEYYIARANTASQESAPH